MTVYTACSLTKGCPILLLATFYIHKSQDLDLLVKVCLIGIRALQDSGPPGTGLEPMI